VLNEITSGGASVNDAYFHGSIPTLAFGGVGESGQGAYRGRASFDTFTHRRSVTTTPGWVEKLIAIRYPPYAGKLARYRLTSELKPNFDREGREIRGVKYWLRFLLGMGSDSLKEALVRWAIAAFVVVGLKKSADAGKLPSYLK
jgi:beta-apo-4'-carotenal oxygenase